MKEHVYEYDEVVVGNDLPALLYSYKHCCPVIFKNTNPPETYEYLDKDINLQNLFFLEEEKTLELPNEQKIVGTRKLELYNRLLYVLSFSGLMPLSDKIEKIRVEKDLLTISTSGAKTIKFKFNCLRIFNPNLVSGLAVKNIKKQKLKVVDLLKIVHEKNQIEQIDVGDDFINRIHFFDGNKIAVISFLSEEDLRNFDFSIIPLQYKLKEVFKDNGINKRSYKSDIIFEHLERNAYNNDKAEYETEKNIIIDKRKEYDICQDTQFKMHSTLLGVYPWRLNHLFMDSNGTIL